MEESIDPPSPHSPSGKALAGGGSVEPRTSLNRVDEARADGRRRVCAREKRTPRASAQSAPRRHARAPPSARSPPSARPRSFRARSSWARTTSTARGSPRSRSGSRRRGSSPRRTPPPRAAAAMAATRRAARSRRPRRSRSARSRSSAGCGGSTSPATFSASATRTFQRKRHDRALAGDGWRDQPTRSCERGAARSAFGDK